MRMSRVILPIVLGQTDRDVAKHRVAEREALCLLRRNRKQQALDEMLASSRLGLVQRRKHPRVVIVPVLFPLGDVFIFSLTKRWQSLNLTNVVRVW